MSVAEFETLPHGCRVALAFYEQMQAVVDLPHVIAGFTPYFLECVKEVAGCRPGIWGFAPPYDEKDSEPPYGPSLDDVVDPEVSHPFETWRADLNQRLLVLLFAEKASMPVGTRWVFADSAIGESAMQRILPRELAFPEQSVQPRDLTDNTDSFWRAVRNGIDRLRWLVLDCNPLDRSFVIFIGAKTFREWALMIRERLVTQGHDWLHISRKGLRLHAEGLVRGQNIACDYILAGDGRFVLVP